MAEPISIGGQTFIKTSDGWIDKKSKIPADKGLLKLLNSLESDGPSPKLRVKIDRNREPVNFAGTKYVYDLNQKGWIDQKTKIKVHDKLQNILNGVSKPMASPASLGLIGQAGVSKTKDRKPDGSGVIPIQKKINEPIVSMISSLSTIDSYLKQRLDNQKKIAKGQLASLRESAIENTNTTDATSVEQLETDEEKEKSNTATLLAGAGITALVLSQFEPVQDAFKVVADATKGLVSFISDFATILNNGFKALGVTPTSSGGGGSAESASMGGDNTTEGQNTTNGATPEQSTTSNVTPDAIPEQSTTSNVTPDAIPEQTLNPNTPTPPNETPPPSPPPPSQGSRSSSMASGASRGAAYGSILGPIGSVAGAAIGGVVGFFSGGSNSSADQATQIEAPSPGATSNDSLRQAVQLAASQVGIGESGIGNYLREGGVGLNPINEAWCAAFVNSTLAQTGLKGATNVANSFQKWGDQVSVSSVQEGDIVILTRGKGPDVTGGHVGIATGVKEGNKVEIIAGNTSNKVKRYFVDDNAKNALQVRRYNPEKPYGAGAVGGAPLGPSAGSAGGLIGSMINIGAGAIKAIGNIMAAGFGEGRGTRSLMDSLNPASRETAAAITRAAVEKNATIAEERSPDSPTASLPNPVNINQNPQSAAIENIALPGDRASVDYYLTRFGFPKIEYNQRSPELRWA